MNVSHKIVSLGKIAVATVGLVSTFFTVIDLMVFLSYPQDSRKKNDYSLWSWQLFMNMFLVTIFVLSHTFLAHKKVKDFFVKYNLQHIQRSFYILVTCASLQLLMRNWCSTTDFYFWRVNLNNKLTFTIFSIVHVFFWLTIYCGCICMDVNELLGLKQVYYGIQELPEPLSCKSLELQRLYSHMRHPSFLAFTVILWFIPIMTLDRFLLSSIITSYMYLAWRTDETDFRYQRIQFGRKFANSY